MSPTFNGSDDVFPWGTTMLHNGEQSITIVPYSDSQSSGVLVLVITSVISIIAVSFLITTIALSTWQTRKSSSPNLFVRTNVAPYFMFLLLSDFMQATGSIMNARWIQNHAVTVGTYCTAQGVIKHLADIGLAIWSLVIASYTFCVLFYRMTIPRWVMYVTIVSVQCIALLITPVGPIIYKAKADGGDFYGISGYWCWITEEYGTARITLDYMIMFLSAFLSFILYSLVFLRMRGNIVVSGWYVRFRMAKNDGWRGRDFAPVNTALSVARQMLLYPIAYTIVILPIAAARFSAWAGHKVPFRVTIFCDVVFLMSGLINVILFFTTRRLLPAQSVFPSWRKLLPRNLFSHPAANAGKESGEMTLSFRVAPHGRGTEQSSDQFVHSEEKEVEALYLPTTKNPQSLRIKIDNHVDTVLTGAHENYSLNSVASSLDMRARLQEVRPPPIARLNNPYSGTSLLHYELPQHDGSL